MDILDVRKLIAEALQKVEGLDRVMPLGNVVYVHVGEKEYEVVIRTVRPEPRTGPYTAPDDDDLP
jgi:hypothetical protein